MYSIELHLFWCQTIFITSNSSSKIIVYVSREASYQSERNFQTLGVPSDREHRILDCKKPYNFEKVFSILVSLERKHCLFLT